MAGYEPLAVPGNAWQSEDLATTRSRPFLTRNIRKFLNQSTEPTHRNGQVWHPPTESMINSLATGGEPTLRIMLKSIVPRTAPRTASQYGEDHITKKRKMSPDLKLSCQVEVSIYQNQKKGPESGDVSTPSKLLTRTGSQVWSACHDAQLLGRANRTSRTTIDVHTKEFRIPSRRLGVLNFDDSGSWKETLADSYDVHIRLRLRRSGDEPPILKWIGYCDDTGNDGDNIERPIELVARWSGLPECPSDLPLPIWRIFRGRKSETLGGFEVDFGWKLQPPLSPLEWNNKFWRGKISLPRTSQTNPDPQPVVHWTVGDSQKTQEGGFLCILCGMAQFTTFKELHHHVLTSHSVNNETTWARKNTRKGAATYEITVKDPQRGVVKGRITKAKVPKFGDTRQSGWLRPTMHFDLSKFLAGNDSWLRNGSRAPQSVKDCRVRTDWTSIRWKEQLLATLPEVLKRTLVVPRPLSKDVHLFSSRTGRLLEPGDLVDNSDDEDERLFETARLRHNVLQLPNYSFVEKQFMLFWNERMFNEPVLADVYMGDWLYRLIVSKPVELRDAAMLAEFIKKIKELREDRIINKTVYKWCLRHLPSLPKTTKGQKDAPAARFNGDVTMGANGHYSSHSSAMSRSNPTTSTNQLSATTSSTSIAIGMADSSTSSIGSKPSARKYGWCSCGKPGKIGGMVYCANEVCVLRYAYSYIAENPDYTVGLRLPRLPSKLCWP
jgi:hypothetical protein